MVPDEPSDPHDAHEPHDAHDPREPVDRDDGDDPALDRPGAPPLRLVHSSPRTHDGDDRDDDGDPFDEAGFAEADARYDALLDEIGAEFPGFRLLRKDESFVQRSIHVLLRVITAGAQADYLDAYVTTLGETVYVPPGWDARSPTDRYVTMRHELVHLRQFRRYGVLVMAVVYLLFPLPMGLAWGRMRLERAAYEETVRAAAEVYGRAHVCDAAFRRHVVAMFTSGAYAWMWPFPRAVERWYDALIARLPADDADC